MPDYCPLSNIKSKIKAEEEKKVRGLTFAKLYFANKDYQSALTYLNDYLSIKQNSAEAYRVLGDTHEALNNNEKALDAYKKSYFIDKTQDNLLFKICEKLETSSADTGTIKSWLDLLEKKYPNHKCVFSLRDKLQLENGNSSIKLEDTFRDLSNVKLSDITDDRLANLSCSFLQASPSITTNQFKSLERGQDRLLKKVTELEEKFYKTTDQLVDLVKESKTMFGQIKNEVDKINQALGKLQIGQQELKQVVDEFVEASYNNEEDEEIDEDDEETDVEESNVTNKSASIFNRLGPVNNSPSTIKPSSTNNSFTNQPLKFDNSGQSLFGRSAPIQQLEKLPNTQISFLPQSPFSSQASNKNIPAPVLAASSTPIVNTATSNLNDKLSSNNAASSNVPLTELFKDQYKNKWSCAACYCANDSNAPKCLACETPNPNLSTPQQPAQPMAAKEQHSATKSPQVSLFAQKLAGTLPKDNSNKFEFGTPENKDQGLSKFQFGHPPNVSLPLPIFGQPPAPISVFSQQTPFSNQQPSSVHPSIFNQIPMPTLQQPPAPLPSLNPTLFGQQTFTGFSFGNKDINNQSNQPVFGINLNQGSITNATSKPAVSKPSSTIESTSSVSKKEEENVEDEPQIDFKPVIPLPDEVEVKTGEEDETILFVHRAKLYRFKDGEWKDRGLGDIKILHDEKNARYRLLMRREQIHKVCLNTPVTNTFEFTDTNKAGNLVRFVCIDFSENLGTPECLALKFKLKETTDEFKKKVYEIVKKLGGKVNESTVQETDKSTAAPKQQQTEKSKEFTKFDDLEVVYVKESKDKDKAEKLKLPSNFYSYEELGPLNHENCFGCRDHIPKLKYEVEDKENQAKSNEENVAPSESGNLFSSAIAESGTTKSVWGTTTEPASWMKSALTPIFSNQKTGAAASDDPEADIVTLDFKPVIPLPDLIDVKTGEEDEEILFSNRAKLFKFTNNEWKERGIGDAKILKHRETGRIRFLMRREQVFKICLNHMVDSGIKLGFREGTKNIFQWTATDFSESTSGEPSIFNLKFKNEDIAKKFLECLKENIPDFKMQTD